MYVVFAEECETLADASKRSVQTLEQAFAQIVCRCGYSYSFRQEQESWSLVLVDIEAPERSPEPIVSSYIKPRDARHDLVSQAVDGRLRGHVALNYDDFAKGHMIVRTGSGIGAQSQVLAE